MSKILYITPHLSTGGLPQYLYKKLEIVSKNEEDDISLIEWEDLAPIYRVQKDLIKEIINKPNFVSWEQGTDVEKKIKHIKNFIRGSHFDIVHLEEFPEFFLPLELINYIYKTAERSYNIVETSHNSGFPIEDKQVLPDAFIFVSKYQIEKFKQFNIPSYLAEYPIERKIKTDRKEALNKLGLDPDYKHVLNVGLFTPGKNQHYAFNIAHFLETEKIQFHFIGNQAENFRNYWEPIMRSKPDNCIVHGEKSNVDDWYDACDLLLFTSTSELNPLVPREALSWSLPVLMNNLEIYQNEYNQYVNYLTGDLFKDSNMVKKVLGIPFENVVGDELPEIIQPIKTKGQKEVFKNVINNVYEGVKIRKYSQLKTQKDKQIKINFNFIDGPFAEVLGGNLNISYNISFSDDEDKIIHQSNLLSNHYTLCYRKWFTNWIIKIKSDDKLIFEHKFDLKDKRVLISFESSSLGDTLAWIPYVEEFRLKHNCKIICSTFWNNLYRNSYPEIEFIKPGNITDNIYAAYKLGCFNPPDDQKWHPFDWRNIPLQKVASDILGLDYQEIKPKIDIPEEISVLENNNYVSMGIHSTCQSKYWNYPDGWQILVNHLKSIEYDVVHISKERGTYMGNTPPRDVLDKTGEHSIKLRIKQILNSKMFIGVSSGLSWLAWALNVPTIMISGVTKVFNEPNSMIKLHNDDVFCNGCFNNNNYIFDKGNWNWCPNNQDFICSKSISPEQVIEKINSILLDGVIKLEVETNPKLVIFTGVYNGQDYIDRCIKSIKSQNYQNFDCYVCDDMSDDDTVKNALLSIDGDSRFSVISRNEKMWGLHNIYDMIHRKEILDTDICIVVDGDDFLPDEFVFDRIVNEYISKDTWLTYGSFNQIKDNKLIDGWSRETDSNNIRESEWVATHLRTFYVGLFRKIKREDLIDIDTGDFYQYSADMAMMFPMIEMAGDHAHYLESINYTYNDMSPINEYKVNSDSQLHCAERIRSRKKYQKLDQLQISPDVLENNINNNILKNFDKDIYKEIFEFNQYTNKVKINNKDTVLDLGCSKGYLYFKCLLENLDVNYIGVDASVFNIQDFTENLYDDFNPILLNLAVDNKLKVIDFDCMFHIGSHQIIPTITFPNLLNLINKPIDFLKFDIEGYEKYIFEDYELFKSKINKFAGEIHFKSDIFLKKDVYSLLEKFKQDPDIEFTLFSIDMVDVTDMVWSIEDYYNEIIINGKILK